MMIDARFDARTQQTLEDAGWYEGREVVELVAHWRTSLVDHGGFKMFPAAEAALLEFGGLRVEQQGPGFTCAREPFELDPLLAVHCEEIFAEFANALGTALFPLGEAVSGHMFLAIAESGEVFLLMDELFPLGGDIDAALVNLITGQIPEGVDGTDGTQWQ